MTKLRLVQSQTCKKAGHGKYTFDQDFIELEEPEFPELQKYTRTLVDEPRDAVRLPDQKTYVYLHSDLTGHYSSFFIHGTDLSNNEGGFGGSVMTCELEDGTVDKVPGPWSSGSYFVNMLLPRDKHLRECAVYLPGRLTGMSYSANVDFLNSLMPIGFSLQLIPENYIWHGRPYYEVWHEGCTAVYLTKATNGESRFVVREVDAEITDRSYFWKDRNAHLESVERIR